MLFAAQATCMEIRGERECKACGTRWSYYDTGDVACPECGSMQSVGVDDGRELHTTTPAEFDLAEGRAAWENRPPDEAVEVVKSACREFARANGFVHGGDLVELDGRRVAARELANAVDLAGRQRTRSDDEAYYVLELLRGADDGNRPPADRVPDAMRAARGLAAADVVERYRRDVREWLSATDRDVVPAANDALGGLETHQKRVQALQGDVPPGDADALHEAARDLNAYLREDDEDAVVTAAERLRGLVED